jgi:hypothetical protein
MMIPLRLAKEMKIGGKEVRVGLQPVLNLFFGCPDGVWSSETV